MVRAWSLVLGFLLVLLEAGCGAGPRIVRLDDPAIEDARLQGTGPDATYSWRVVEERRVAGLRLVAMEMTSQRWLDESRVGRPVWSHWLTLAIPDGATNGPVLLSIAGGSNLELRAPLPDESLLAAALATKTIAAELRMVPNEPLAVGAGSPEESGDALVAMGWERFLGSGDASWLLEPPMTTAVVRGMDTVIAQLKRMEGLPVVERFVLTADGLRARVAWLVAARDRRVVGLVPRGFDQLNSGPFLAHLHRIHGKPTPAMQPWLDHGITEAFGSREFAALQRRIDPFVRRDRLALPKLIVNGADDELSPPDSSQFYAGQLPGPTYLRYVPNADGTLAGSDAGETLGAWHWMLAKGRPLPRFKWRFEDEGFVVVEAVDVPRKVTLWQAHNRAGRDFRKSAWAGRWLPSNIPGNGKGLYVAGLTEPDEGAAAYFAELEYDVGGPAPLKVTTGVWVLPKKLPHDPPVWSHGDDWVYP